MTNCPICNDTGLVNMTSCCECMKIKNPKPKETTMPDETQGTSQQLTDVVAETIGASAGSISPSTVAALPTIPPTIAPILGNTISSVNEGPYSHFHYLIADAKRAITQMVHALGGTVEHIDEIADEELKAIKADLDAVIARVVARIKKQ